MAHTYVSLDDAAEILGLSVDEVKSLRESGELRGFADRGTWKFRRDHIDEYIRSTTAGSDPDIPIFDESGPGASDLFAIHPGAPAESDGDSDETGRNAIPGMDLADDGDFNFGEDVDFAEPANTDPPKPKSKPQAADADDSGDFMVEEEFSVADGASANETSKLARPEVPPAETGKLARPETGTAETGKLPKPDVPAAETGKLEKPEPSPAETGKLARPADDADEEAASADSTGRLKQPVLEGDSHDEDEGEIDGLGVDGLEIDGRPAPAESAILGGADDSGINLVPDEVDSVSAELHEHDSGIILADLDSGIGAATSDVLDDRESGLDLIGAGSDVLDEGDEAAEPPVLGVEDSRVLIGSEALTGTDFSGDSHVAKVDSDVDLTAAKETVDETGDSGIALDVGDVDETGDSGIALEVGGDDESGIALDLGGDDESGIALDIGGDESGIALDFSDAEESGIALDIGGDESGIALDLDGGSVLDAGDSGIALDTGDSGIALDAGDSGIALDFADSGVDSAADGTQRMELVTSPEDGADDFADFDDADAGADGTQRVAVPAAGATADEVDEFGETISEERIDTLDDFDDGGSFDEIEEVDAGFEDELDEIDDFEEEDEFAEVGASADPFEDDDDWDEPPVAAKPRGPQWGIVPLVGLALCTLVMTASVMITWQSMRVMWTGATESQTAFDQAVDEITKLVP